ncbi:MAG: magnesium transporter CorA family protein [Bacillota bacterium]
MIQIFNSANDILQEIDCDISRAIDVAHKWIHLTNPTDKEIELISRLTAIPEDMLKAALDEEERARLEIDDGVKLVLFDIPTIEDESSYFSYSTMPFGAMLSNNCIVTVCLKESSIIHSLIYGNQKLQTTNRLRMLYQMMYSTHISFLHCLRQIDKASGRIQSELQRTTRNEELIQLLDLENSLVYFSTSLKANKMVIERLTRLKTKGEDEEDRELLEDVAIENNQAIDMCNNYRDIMSGTRDAYASVISNNLNMIMKVLTSLTVVLSIPTLIASFWGMNTTVPFENQLWGFYAVLAIALASTIIGGVWMSKNQIKIQAKRQVHHPKKPRSKHRKK